MTLPALNSAIVYFGDGVTKAYTIAFPMLDAADLEVLINDDVPPFGYQITGDVTVFGAVLTFASAPAVGDEILLRRNTPLSQDTDYITHGPYRAEQVESDFDKLMMAAQDVRYRADHPAPVDAINVDFDPSGSNYTADNVQNALIEVDNAWRTGDAVVTDYVDQVALTKVNSSVSIISQDTQVLTVVSPTLADDVVLVPITNVPNGFVKLDASGHIPTSLFAATGVAFKGMWNPNVQGAAPPGSSANGDFYLFDGEGNMTLAENTNIAPHTVAVFINDQMIWSIDRWYYVHAAQFQIINAAGVIFAPVGTIGSTNVQNAIAELDASISLRFKDEGDEIGIYRSAKNLFGVDILEYVFRTTTQGPRIIVAKKDVLAIEFDGIKVFGSTQSGLVAQTSGVHLRSADGVTMGRIGFLGDASFYVISDRPESPININVTNIAGNQENVIQAFPSGPNAGVLLRAVNQPVLRTEVNVVRMYSTEAGNSAAPLIQQVFQSADGTVWARVGYLGSGDFYVAVDRPGAVYRIELANGLGSVAFDAVTGFVVSKPIYGTQVIATAPAPTASNHLTRKDYVDALLAGAGSFDSPQQPMTAQYQTAHGLLTIPRQIWATCVCVLATAGYLPGDSIELPGVQTWIVSGVAIQKGYGVWANGNDIGFTRSPDEPLIVPKGGGALVSMISANWNVILHARK